MRSLGTQGGRRLRFQPSKNRRLPPMPASPTDHLALQRLYLLERSQAERVCLTQPMGQCQTQTYTWAQVGDQVRRMAAHLKALGQDQGWEPGAKVAILSKNCAWWLFSDLAIWMAGYVSVPLYPTLEIARAHV